MQPDRFHLIAAVFIILIKDNQVFLSRRKNTGWEDGKYSLVGGHLDGDETASHAAIREAKEEIGVIINQKDVRFFNMSHLITNTERIHISFVADAWEGEPTNAEPEKADDARWFPLNNLPDNLTDISRQTLEWYKNNVVYTEFGWEKLQKTS